MDGVNLTILAQGQPVSTVAKSALTGVQEFLLVNQSITGGVAQAKDSL